MIVRAYCKRHSTRLANLIPGSIRILNAASAGLQSLPEFMDSACTPDAALTPAATLSTSNEGHDSESLTPAVTLAQQSSQPVQSKAAETERPAADASGSLNESSPILPLRRASGLAITSQVTAWPPVASTGNPTSSSQSDPILSDLQIQQRSRTSSVPPSAFNRILSVTLDSNPNESAPSLTLKALRATRGHVLQKAKFYGDLDREASAAMEARDRRLSYQEDRGVARLAPLTQSKLVDSSDVDSEKEKNGLMPPIDIVTDIPEELRNILAQRSASVMADPVAGVPEPEGSSTVVSSDPRGADCTQESTQQFVYTGIDAESRQLPEAAPSLTLSSEHSLCQEFSSYAEVSEGGPTPKKDKPEPPVESPDVFSEKPTAQARLAHESEPSVVSMESMPSYCMVTKRPAVQPIPPLVIHGRQTSLESAGLSADDTFAFASRPFAGSSQPLTGVIRSGHRRTRSVTSVPNGSSKRTMNRGSSSSGDGELSFARLGRPEMGEKMVYSNLPGIMASPLNSDRTIDFTASEPTSPVSPDVGFTSSDSLFGPSHNAGASIFGLEGAEKALKGNLLGAQRPTSVVSDPNETGPLSDNGSHATLECFDGERVSSKILDQMSPCDQNKKKRVVSKRRGIPSFDPPTKDDGLASRTEIDLNAIDKLLAEEIASTFTDRPKSRSPGRRKGKQRPSTIAVDSNCEVYVDLPALYHSPTRSRGSSSTSGAGSTQTDHCESSVAIAEAEPEVGMVLQRYYTLHREAQEEIEHSRQLWEDTPFSMDELSGQTFTN